MGLPRHTFMEFFAGGGMARLGLGPNWTCVFANDSCPRKARVYRANFGPAHFVEGDIADLSAKDLPRGRVDLAWASFPCQDLSFAGARMGLNAPRSGTFFAFVALLKELAAVGRLPRVVALENVPGLLTSRGGQDFISVTQEMADLGYYLTADTIDARAFLPQSRKRLFLMAIAEDCIPKEKNLVSAIHKPNKSRLQRTIDQLPDDVKLRWFWPNTAQVKPLPPLSLDEVISSSGPWQDAATTNQLLSRLSTAHRQALISLQNEGMRRVLTGFQRIRGTGSAKTTFFELRFDGLAGCLRTPAGGSSRQFVVVVDGPVIRTRLMSAREAARLMGLPDTYRLDLAETPALRLCGDGVCVPVVRALAQALIEPALAGELQILNESRAAEGAVSLHAVC
ncbi:MAG: DNA cytosine methyltransferase [Pseudomonadota bacterium]